MFQTETYLSKEFGGKWSNLGQGHVRSRTMMFRSSSNDHVECGWHLELDCVLRIRRDTIIVFEMILDCF